MHYLTHVMTALHIRIYQRSQVIASRILIDKERKKLTTEKRWCWRVICKNSHDIFVVEISCLPKKCFGQIVMITGQITRSQPLDMPSSERRCSLINVLLSIVP